MQGLLSFYHRDEESTESAFFSSFSIANKTTPLGFLLDIIGRWTASRSACSLSRRASRTSFSAWPTPSPSLCGTRCCRTSRPSMCFWRILWKSSADGLAPSTTSERCGCARMLPAPGVAAAAVVFVVVVVVVVVVVAGLYPPFHPRFELVSLTGSRRLRRSAANSSSTGGRGVWWRWLRPCALKLTLTVAKVPCVRGQPTRRRYKKEN